MTDEKVANKKAEVEKESKSSDIEKLLKGLRNGECKGIGGGIAYKIAQYAKEIGVYK